MVTVEIGTVAVSLMIALLMSRNFLAHELLLDLY